MRGGPPNAILHQDDILGRAENEFISGCSCAIIRHLTERWMSGLSHHPGKVAQGYPCREFESRSLRHFIILNN